jgi:geranylgeranyl diphosphate synthase, type II
METAKRIEQALLSAVALVDRPACPPKLVQAVRHAVFPGGARIRPQLCIAVACACGDDAPELSDAAAVAIELLHCASLVHDDLPCFDNAQLRRGKPSVHRAYGERLAVLAGDGLIVLAFEVLARAGADKPQRLTGLLATVAQGVGMPSGITAGQAWECETRVVLSDYQRAKTGALFAAATMAGAQAAGAAPLAWQGLGEWLGEAYQVADDVRDVAMDAAALGKPAGQDATHGRPSAAHELGVSGAIHYFEQLIARASDSIPNCHGAHVLRSLLHQEAERLLPKAMSEELTRLMAE